MADSHSVADTVPARQYLCLDADLLITGDLTPLFAALDVLPPQSVLVCRDCNNDAYLNLGNVLWANYGGNFIFRAIYPQAFADASRAMLIQFGTANTFILICSSLTMALGVHAAQVGARKMLVVMLIITMLFGTAFLVNKGFEYHQEWKEHHVPGPGYEFPESRDPRHAEIFFSLYFIMTGIHTVHLIIGIGVVGVIAFFSWKGHYPPQYHTPVENVGLYWHFVDIVWVFLYPMLYLVAHRHIS